MTNNIRVELQLEDGSFTTGVMHAGQSLSKFKEELRRTNRHFDSLSARGQDGFRTITRVDEGSQSLLHTFRDLSIIGGGVTLMFDALSGASNSTIGNLIRVNSEMEKLRFEMAGLSTAADPIADAEEKVAALRDMATKTPFGLNALSTSFAKLKAAGIDPMNGSLQAITDGLAAFGGSDDQLNRITLGLSQMAGKGVIQMEELRQQLGETMPAAMKIMARSMGVSIAELTKAISTGRVEAGAALEKWFAETARSYSGMGDMMMQTFSGRLNLIKTELTTLTTAEGTGIREAFEQLKGMMGDFADVLKTEDAQLFFNSIGTGLKGILDFLKAVGEGLWQVGDTLSHVGKMALYAFGLMIGVKGLKTVISSVRLLKVELLGLQMDAAKAATGLSMIAGARATSFATGAAASVRGAASQMGGAASAAAMLAVSNSVAMQRSATFMSAIASHSVKAAGGFKMLLGFGVRFLGVFGPLGLAVSALAPIAWDIGKAIWSWATGAKEAKREVKSIQEEALEGQLNQITELEARRAELEKRIKSINSKRGIWKSQSEGFRANALNEAQAELDFVKEEIDALTEQSGKIRAEITENAQKKLIEDQVKAIEKNSKEAVLAVANTYRVSQDASAEAYNKARNEELNAGGSGRKAREAYQEELRANDAERLKGLLAIEQANLDIATQGFANGTVEKGTLTVFSNKVADIQEQLNEVSSRKYQVELLMAGENEEKKFNRLTRTFDSANDKVVSLSAELNGASGEVSKLFHQIERGDFGRLAEADEITMELVDGLKQATIAAEAMDAILKGTDSAYGEISRIFENLQEENLKYLAQINGVDTSNELDFFNFKKDNGFLDGIGKTPAETVQMAIEQVTGQIDDSKMKFRALGDVIRDEAFGSDTIDQIDKVTAALGRVEGAVTGINNFANNLTLPKGIALSGQTRGSAVPSVTGGQAGAILDLISRAEGTNDYNTTLGYGKFTNGPVDLVSKTLREVLAIQERMLMHPENNFTDNRGKKGSSAVGRYQITGETLRDAMKAMGLSGDELFDAKMQDQIALHLLQQTLSAGNSIGSRWQGIAVKGLENEAQAIVGGSNYSEMLKGATTQHNRIDEKNTDAQTLAIQTDANRKQALLVTTISDLNAKIKALGVENEFENIGDFERKVKELIASGDVGSGSTDINAAEYKDALDTAIKLDKLNAQISQNKRDDRDIAQAQEKIDENALEIAERMAEAQERISNPNYNGMSSDMQKLLNDQKEYLAVVERRHGIDSDEYRNASARAEQQKSALASAEAAEAYIRLRQETDDALKSTMTPGQQRESALNDQIKKLATIRDEAVAAGQNVDAANRDYNTGVAALQAAFNKENYDALNALRNAVTQSSIDNIEDDKARAEAEYEQRKRDLLELKNTAIENGASVAEAQKLFDKAVQNERVRYLKENKTELMSTIEEMGRLSDNVNNLASGWAQGLSDVIYSAVADGDNSIAELGSRIQEEIARSLIDSATSSLLKPFEKAIAGDGTSGSGLGDLLSKGIEAITTGLFGSFKAGSTGTGGGLLSGLFTQMQSLFTSMFGSLFGGTATTTAGVRHSGGMVGTNGWSRNVPVANFIGAPKFHTGGIVGKSKFRSGLNASEVPIIAQKGEGVFTAEQMKSLGGTINSNSISINSPITVNATGGTPEQNQDLAKQVSKQSEAMMRAVVQQEIIRQMRPGGIMR